MRPPEPRRWPPARAVHQRCGRASTHRHREPAAVAAGIKETRRHTDTVPQPRRICGAVTVQPSSRGGSTKRPLPGGNQVPAAAACRKREGNNPSRFPPEGGVEFSTGSVASVVRGRPEGGASAARVAESAAASALPAWGRGTQSSRGACYQYTRSPGDTEQRRTRSGQPGAPAAGGSAAAGGSDCAAGGGASPGSAGASAGSGVVYGTCSNSAVRCFARSPRRS